MRDIEYSPTNLDRFLRSKKSIIARKQTRMSSVLSDDEELAVRALMNYDPSRDDDEATSLIKELSQENRIKIYESDFGFIIDYFIESLDVTSVDLETFIFDYVSKKRLNRSKGILRDLIYKGKKGVANTVTEILHDMDDETFLYWFTEISSVMEDSGYMVLNDPDGMGHVIVLDMR